MSCAACYRCYYAAWLKAYQDWQDVRRLAACYVCVCVYVHNRFIVPEDKIDEFEAAWQEREAVMQQLPGFLGFSLHRQDGSNFTATSKYVCFACPCTLWGQHVPSRTIICILFFTIGSST